MIAAALLSPACSVPTAHAPAAATPLAAVTPTAAGPALQPFSPTTALPTPTLAPTLPTSTPPPTSTPTPTLTLSPTPTLSPASTPIPTYDPARHINGIRFEVIAVMPSDTVDHVREIAALGRELGRNPRAFSKLGDSAVLTEANLTRFDNGPVTLGPYAFLQPVIDYYAGSWARYGAGARVALTAVGAFDPMWANPNYCLSGEHLLDCEVRLHNPAVLLIRLGTNDGNAERYERYLGQIIEYCLEHGIIPILGTKADRYEGDDSINEATRRLAAAYRLPLWDFDVLAATLPNRGLRDDHAHLTAYPRNDYTDPQTFTHGYPMSDLSTLVVLEAIMQITSDN